MSNIAAELASLQRFAALANDHHSIFKDLALLTQLQVSSSAVGSASDADPLRQLSFLQQFSSLATPLAGTTFTAHHLEEHTRGLSDSALRDSIATLADQAFRLRVEFETLFASVQGRPTDSPLSEASITRQIEPLLSQHHQLDSLMLHLFVRAGEQAKGEHAHHQERMKVWSIAAALTFAFGTVLLLWGDWLAMRERPIRNAAGQA